MCKCKETSESGRGSNELSCDPRSAQFPQVHPAVPHPAPHHRPGQPAPLLRLPGGGIPGQPRQHAGPRGDSRHCPAGFARDQRWTGKMGCSKFLGLASEVFQLVLCLCQEPFVQKLTSSVHLSDNKHFTLTSSSVRCHGAPADPAVRVLPGPGPGGGQERLQHDQLHQEVAGLHPAW